MSKRRVVLWTLIIMTVTGTSFATLCTLDNVPAATLLFPYVVYDYNQGGDGDNTILTITNTGPDAQIVHVTIWSDTHIPVIGFNMLLSGYDVQSLSIRDVLDWGWLPVTVHGTSGGVAEHGPVDGTPDLSAPVSTSSLAQRCPADTPAYPGYLVTPIPATVLSLIKSWLQLSQTVPRLHSDCEGSTYPGSTWNPEPFFDTRTTSDPTWMYVTADVVWTCNLMLPSVDAALYWQDGPTNNPSFSTTGAQRMTDNVLMGDLIWVNLNERLSESVAAVHIEADDALGDTSYNSPVRNASTGMVQTFAHAQSAPHGVSDQREPLPTAWAVRYFHAQGMTETRLRVWKAPTLEPDLDFDYSCATDPSGTPWVYPQVTDIASEMHALDCRAYTYYAWDENEQVVSGPGAYPNRLPLAVQEVSVEEFFLPGNAGWMLFLWPPSNTDEADHYQTWTGVEHINFGNFSVARPGTVVWNSNCVQPVHASGFELGNTGGWDVTSSR
jgi:hypothetical protein